MTATSSGERTVVEAASNEFAVAPVLTNGDETTTGSPGCEGATRDDGVLEAALEAGAEETTVEGKAAAKLLLVCLVDIIARTTEDKKSRRKGRTNARFGARSKLYNLTLLESKTHTT